MSNDLLKYDQMVEETLRDVIRMTLLKVAERGLPGDHQLYITFLTDHPGVIVADHLSESFPHDMTIVLQHQFWGLEVSSDAFSVSLSFNDLPENLHIPYDAVTVFADPSVNFALRFRIDQTNEELEADSYFDTKKKSDVKLAASTEPVTQTKTADDNVVTLDTFRKS